MEGKMHWKYDLPDRSYSGIVKKEIREVAVSLGFSLRRLGEVDIIVSELISNLVKYAGEKGEFLVRKIRKDDVSGLEVICIDNGVGMKYPDRMMTDGISTTGSLGQGLGAVKRLSAEFGLYSLPDWGTVILSRVYDTEISIESSVLDFGAIAVPVDQEATCGDGWGIVHKEGLLSVLGVDGLGHGADASYAASVAIDYFNQSRNDDIIALLRDLDTEIKNTRGAVCFIARMDVKRDIINYAGIGNISAKIISTGKIKNCISFNGVVGYAMPTSLTESTAKWKENDLFIMHSDGIKSKWDLKALPHIERQDPVVIAAALYKDNKRGYDDSLVLVVKRNLNKN